MRGAPPGGAAATPQGAPCPTRAHTHTHTRPPPQRRHAHRQRAGTQGAAHDDVGQRQWLARFSPPPQPARDKPGRWRQAAAAAAAAAAGTHSPAARPCSITPAPTHAPQHAAIDGSGGCLWPGRAGQAPAETSGAARKSARAASSERERPRRLCAPQAHSSCWACEQSPQALGTGSRDLDAPFGSTQDSAPAALGFALLASSDRGNRRTTRACARVEAASKSGGGCAVFFCFFFCAYLFSPRLHTLKTVQRRSCLCSAAGSAWIDYSRGIISSSAHARASFVRLQEGPTARFILDAPNPRGQTRDGYTQHEEADCSARAA